MEVDDVGEVSADCIFRFFHDEKNKEMIARLKSLGVNMEAERDRDDRFGSQWKNSCHTQVHCRHLEEKKRGTGWRNTAEKYQDPYRKRQIMSFMERRQVLSWKRLVI